MVYSNLSLIIELPQQSTNSLLVLGIGALGTLLGAIAAGWIKYAMEKKNRVLQAYSQLISRKYILMQRYQNLLDLTISIAYNSGLSKEAENLAKKYLSSSPTKRNYINKANELENLNSHNKELIGKESDKVIKATEQFWRAIGTINGVINTKELNEQIEDIKKAQDYMNNFQRKLSNETKDGLPYKEIDENNYLNSTWPRDKKQEIICEIEKFEAKIDHLINYLRDNEINQPWFKYLW